MQAEQRYLENKLKPQFENEIELTTEKAKLLSIIQDDLKDFFEKVSEDEPIAYASNPEKNVRKPNTYQGIGGYLELYMRLIRYQE